MRGAAATDVPGMISFRPSGGGGLAGGGGDVTQWGVFTGQGLMIYVSEVTRPGSQGVIRLMLMMTRMYALALLSS